MLSTRPPVGAPTPGALCRAPRALLSGRPFLVAPLCAAPASGPGPASSGPPGPPPSSIDYINPAYFYANPFAPAQGAASSSSAPGSNVPGCHATVLRTVDSVVAAASAARAAATARAAVAARSASPSTSATSPGSQAQTRTPAATAAAANASSASTAAASPAAPAPSTAPVQLSAAAAAALADNTFASMDEGDSPSTAPGGVRLLVVVGVVLLDDPQWDHETGEPSLQQQQQQQGTAADRPVRVLLAQRPVGKSNAGLWEFPGGKVDPGETPEAALVRELREELGITVDPADLAPLTFASHTYPTFHLLMPLYACRRWSGVPVGAEGQAVAWAAAGEVTSYNLTPADIPLVPAVLAAMRHTG